MRTWVFVAWATAVAAAGAQGVDPSYVVGGAFGAHSYEAFALAAGQLERSYNVGFYLGADFYRNDGRVTHLVTFDYLSSQNYSETEPIKIFEFNYNLPIYFASGRFRPAVRPFFGARFATGDDGGSGGQLGILGGIRVAPSPGKYTFSDLYFGWRGRYTSLPFEWAPDSTGWKSSFVFRTASTIEVVMPFCIYVTAALDFDFSDVGPVGGPVEPESRKPAFAGGVGPAFYF